MVRLACVLVLALALLASCKGKHAHPHESRPPPGGDAHPPGDALLATAPDATAPAARSEHVVWNLVDNRHTAHRALDNEVVLDARSIGFARFTRFGMPEAPWQLGAQVGGERAALANKLVTLELPLTPEQTAPTQLTLRVHADTDKQALEVRIHGGKAGTRSRVALETGWQTIAVRLEHDALVPGENVIALQTLGKGKQRVALSWLRAGAIHPSADQDPLAAATFDAAGDALELAEHASVAWYVTIPEGAHLVANVAAPCLVEVGARAGDATFAGGLLAADQDRVDLSALAGKAVRLSLLARDCPRARLLHPRITVHGPAPSPLPLAAPVKHVLLWKRAGLRTDPAFDELARASAVFRQFEWVDVDRAAVGKAVATTAKLSAVLVADATVDSMLATIEQSRDKPLFLYADTSTEQGPQLARVTAQLKSWGLWDTTLLIVADEHELVIHDAARYPSGTIIDEGAEASDLVPTIVDALGQLAAPSPGASLAALAQGIGRGWSRPSYASPTESTHVLRIDRWSIRVGSAGVAVVTDAVDDPVGAVNLAASRPIERRMLTDSLGLLLPLRTQWRKSEWGVVSNLSPAGARALDEAAAP